MILFKFNRVFSKNLALVFGLLAGFGSAQGGVFNIISTIGSRVSEIPASGVFNIISTIGSRVSEIPAKGAVDKVLDGANRIVESRTFQNGERILSTVVLPGLLCWMIVKQIKLLKSAESKQFEISQNVAENFDSVAGAEEAKEALQETVNFLKYPIQNQSLGAKIPTGILLTGNPGNGKTLLARAVAGEAGCPVIAVSGSEFVEMLIGKGAATVRSLFKTAREVAEKAKTKSCIIFIDEIDAIGAARGRLYSCSESDQTLNELLVQMDGFNKADEAKVIVIAATNRDDMLDQALLRPGRFDRVIHVPYPNLQAREEILAIHMRSVAVSSDIDKHKLAIATAGFSGAELAKLVNEAAIIASKDQKDFVEMGDFEEAWQSMLLGKKVKSITLTDAERKATAIHEAGHALIALMLPECAPLHAVTIEPRGNALGLTFCLPEREKFGMNKQEMLAEITKALGGRAAEELVFNDINTGAGNDLEKASKMARKMVVEFGMIDVGHVAYSASHGDIDKAVYQVINECYARAKEIIAANRDKLEMLADELLDKGELTAGQVYKLLNITPRFEHKIV